ncbi:transposase-like protein [Hirsutella rhossiliensis]|uniref:Transposase-like protein n=1 Tax=Hirsutella rhossiliensis TaxID=111463 RepID=A0A9P8SLN3_9HYPO|nr:transposase-like protein [Hirsutella rhossiliensis]KAH0965331.1 transposase-like protein [Hirsutella rhossiliensis]
MGSYEIGQNVGFFMMDNASSNDTCIRELAKRYPVIKPQSRLRCVGHMLNLIVKALLFGQGVGKLEKQLCGASEVERFEIWRKHSFRAVKLRHAIDLFFLNYCYGGVGYDISQDVLTPQDWIDLHHFLDILKPFKDLTKRMEGRANKAGLEGSHGSLHETIESFDVLFKKLQEAGRFADDHPDVVSTYYSHAIDAARIKLEEYFGLTDATPAYREAKSVVQEVFAEYEDAYMEADAADHEEASSLALGEVVADKAGDDLVALDPLQEARKRRQMLAELAASGKGRRKERD